MPRIPAPDDVILGLLCVQPMHGYELLRRFEDRGEFGSVWRLSASQLYVVLKRLADGGWIAGHQVASPQAPARTEYAVTESGRERLQAWLAEPNPSPSVRTARVEFVSRLIVARSLHLPSDATIRAQRSACESRLADLRTVCAQSPHPNERLSLALVIAQTEALLHWIDDTAGHFLTEKENPG